MATTEERRKSKSGGRGGKNPNNVIKSIPYVQGKNKSIKSLPNYEGLINSPTANRFYELVKNKKYDYGAKGIGNWTSANSSFYRKTDDDSIDCSGTVCTIRNAQGENYDLTGTSAASFKARAKHRNIPIDQTLDGDLILMDIGGKGIDHIGFIVVDDKGRRYIAESSSSYNGTTITPYEDRINNLKSIAGGMTYEIVSDKLVRDRSAIKPINNEYPHLKNKEIIVRPPIKILNEQEETKKQGEIPSNSVVDNKPQTYNPKQKPWETSYMPIEPELKGQENVTEEEKEIQKSYDNGTLEKDYPWTTSTKSNVPESKNTLEKENTMATNNKEQESNQERKTLTMDELEEKTKEDTPKVSRKKEYEQVKYYLEKYGADSDEYKELATDFYTKFAKESYDQEKKEQEDYAKAIDEAEKNGEWDKALQLTKELEYKVLNEYAFTKPANNEYISRHLSTKTKNEIKNKTNDPQIDRLLDYTPGSNTKLDIQFDNTGTPNFAVLSDNRKYTYDLNGKIQNFITNEVEQTTATEKPTTTDDGSGGGTTSKTNTETTTGGTTYNDINEVLDVDNELQKQAVSGQTDLTSDEVAKEIFKPQIEEFVATKQEGINPWENVMDIGRMVTAWGDMTQDVPEYERGDMWKEAMADARGMKDMGFTPDEMSLYKNLAERGYAYDVSNIRRLAGGSAGVALGNLGRATSQLYGQYGKMAAEDARLRRQNMQNFQQMAGRDEMINRQIFQDDLSNVLREIDSAGMAFTDAMGNIQDRIDYNKQYGPGSLYEKYMNALASKEHYAAQNQKILGERMMWEANNLNNQTTTNKTKETPTVTATKGRVSKIFSEANPEDITTFEDENKYKLGSTGRSTSMDYDKTDEERAEESRKYGYGAYD